MTHYSKHTPKVFCTETFENVTFLKTGILEPFTIRVVDWGYAVDVHTSQPFAGGLDCASDLALKSVIERRSIVYQKSDDLVSLLRSFYLTLHGHNGLDTFAFGNKDFQGHAEKTMAFWKSHGQSELWQELFQLAESCDYQGLKNKIAELY